LTVYTADLKSDGLIRIERAVCYFAVTDLKYSIMNVCPVL
jgi:hypothetical protein